MTERKTHKIRYANLLLLASMVCHFFITLGVYRWIQATNMAYALQVLLMALPVLGGICVPCLVYEAIRSKADRVSLRSALAPEKPSEKPVMVLYIVLFALLTYVVVCYLNFAVRGIVQYFTDVIALKQLAFTGGVLGILSAVLILAALPAAAGEFLNKKIVAPAYAQTGAVLSFFLPVLFSVVFFTNVQTLLFRLCYGCAAMLVYRRTKSYLFSALFIFVALIPDAVSGGGTWLPLDYRATLSADESLMRGLFALGVAFTAAIGWLALARFVFFRGAKKPAVFVKPDYYDLMSILILPFAYFLLYLMNVFVL